jgi:hypothetical protein
VTSRSALSRPIRLGVALAALALLVRMLVPAGFMPAAAAGGMPTLVLCSGQGPMGMPIPHAMAGMAGMAAMDHGSDHSGQHDGDTANHGCFLGAISGAVDIAAPPVPVALPFIVATVSRIATVVTRPGLGLAAPPPPKTGPPILA